MAHICKEEVDLLASLSRIALTDEEKELACERLGKVLNYAEQLNEIDTEGVEPLSYVFEKVGSPMREDEVEPTLPREEFLKNAPDQVGGMVRVPAVIKQ